MTAEASALDEAMPHILVVDDDTRLRKLLQKFLRENGFRVTLAENAADAKARLGGLQFDVIILDVMMPGQSGLELTEELRGQSEVPILLLSALSETESRITGLELGADDYLGKPFEPRELLARLRALLRRQAAQPTITPALLRFGEWEADIDRGELRKQDEQVSLTSAEQTMLRLLAEKPGVPISRAELCEKTGVVQERTVDVQITRLRRKIERDARAPRYLRTVRGQGYALWPD